MHCKCKLVNYSIKRNAFVTVHPYQCAHVKEFWNMKTRIGLDRFFGFFFFFVKHLLIFFTPFCCLFDFEYSITIFKLHLKAVWRSKMWLNISLKLFALPVCQPHSVTLLTDPCHFWSSFGQRVHQIPSVTAKQLHNEKYLHISSVSQTLFETKSPYRPCVLFTVLIGGKINALCISTRLLKQDKNCMNRSEPVGIEWIV